MTTNNRVFRVKPLVWKDDVAVTILGKYVWYYSAGGLMSLYFQSQRLGQYDTTTDMKLAAEAHYRARIEKALEEVKP